MYSKGLPFKLKLQLRLAEKNGLFDDIGCPDCDKTNTINYRYCKIKYSGIRFSCNHCGLQDLFGLDIVEEACDEYVKENPYRILTILYKIVS